MAKKGIPRGSQYAHERRLLFQFLSGIEDRDRVVTWDELEAVVGFDVRQHRHVLEGARRDCQAETGLAFMSVRGEGLKLYTDSERCKTAEQFRKRGQRMAKRSTQLLSGVEDVAKLSEEDLLSLNVGLTQAALVQRVTSATRTKKLREAIQVQGELPTAKALDLFR